MVEKVGGKKMLIIYSKQVSR